MNVQDLLRKFESSQENKEHCGLTKSNSFCHGFNDADELRTRNGIGKRKCIHDELNSKPVAGPIVVKSNVENGTYMESSRRQPKMNIYGTINNIKSSSNDAKQKETDNNQTGVINNNNNIPKTQVPPVAPKKPPRTFAHDIYLRQKNCQTASPEVRKPAPPPKPSFYQTPVASGSFRDRKYSMPQKMCAKPATRPSTPPPPRPPSSGVASSRTQWYEATNTIPRSSKGRNDHKSKETTKDRSCASKKHIYDEPASETGPLRYPNNNFCHVANGNLNDKQDKPDKPRDLHYMSTPVYVQKISSEFPTFETGSWRANNDNDTADNVKSPTKKGFNLVRDVVNWSVSCIGQPMAPSS